MSDSNKMTDETSFQPSEPAPCATGCGYFGAAATNGYCSKCFRDIRIQEEQAASAIAAINKVTSPNIIPFSSTTTTSSVSCGSVPVEPLNTASTAEPVQTKQKMSNRCLACNKKVGVMGFKCKCGDMFCGNHRYPETHDCEFDFKRTGKDAIAKANPVVKADKVDRI